MPDDFRGRLISHAQTVIERAKRAQTEAATQQYLILPFFQLLGYDPLNPDEIIPEAHASFSDKFKNRVDYAICIEGESVMAVECKCAGKIVESNRGELKGYFNAVPSVKLGILTDGIVYELYSDTDRENMMDDSPFVRIDFSEVARGQVTDNALDALQKLRKGTFDPADVGADARRKLYVASYVSALEASIREPPEKLVRTLMDLANIEGRRTPKLIEEHTPIIGDALQVFFDKKLLERVGFAERQDLVRVPASAAPPVMDRTEVDVVEASADGVITTETEMGVFDYIRSRLSYLVRDELLYEKISEVAWIDRKTTFTVYYRQERKGRIFNFRELSDSKERFEFPDETIEVITGDYKPLDRQLLETYRKRVQELG